MSMFPLCLAAPVNATALQRLLEEGQVGGYRDTHPWHVAARLLEQARAAEQTLVLLLASGQPLQLSHWAPVRAIQIGSSGGGEHSRVELAAATAVHPLFTELEAVTLAPSELQLQREQLEGLRPRRVHLDGHWLRPYAICETPPFLDQRSEPHAGEDTHRN